jgi:hypothetical protein
VGNSAGRESFSSIPGTGGSPFQGPFAEARIKPGPSPARLVRGRVILKFPLVPDTRMA